MAPSFAQAALERLGFTDVPTALHASGQVVDRGHPYATEIGNVLHGADAESVLGIYDIDGVPAICLIAGRPGQPQERYERLRAQLWNQGLMSVLLVVGERALQAWPVASSRKPSQPVERDAWKRDNAYSAYGARSGVLQALHPEWFDPKDRIDKVLLRNLTTAVDQLTGDAGPKVRTNAQHLMAQVLFVSYLEDRGLIPASLGGRSGGKPFARLLEQRDRDGLQGLFDALRERFNGDFLTPSDGRFTWSRLTKNHFDVLDRFLQREDLLGGQHSLWRYDFRFVPVELLSGLYESFLTAQRKRDGAYYTPRHLANLVVDEALRGIEYPEREVIWDGACGSGILLTTAFRRMLGAAEQRAGRKFSLAERTALLKGQVFGGDINSAACTIAAFSLYLCLLEDLSGPPTTRLPTLLGKNIFDREHDGDVFSPDHPIVVGKIPHPTIILSNAPWAEPAGSHSVASYETWVHGKVPLRQIATAYALRATELVATGGRVCLILPASTFVRPLHRPFVEAWIERVRMLRLINFSDLRRLLFPGARHPCMVVVAQALEPGQTPPPGIQFDYVTPKADLGLLYNRLTVHASDRHALQQSRLRLQPDVLQGLYWGSERELAEVERLCLAGTFASVIKQTRGRSGSGFHVTDGAKAVEPGLLRKQPHIAAGNLPKVGPALPTSAIQPWPVTLRKVASIGERALYEGARIIVPNGMTPEHRIRAFAIEEPASVSNSCSVLRLGSGDFPLARLAAVYLSSQLAAYFAMLRAPSAVTERTQIKHGELLTLPFRLPSQHSDPDRANAIVGAVSSWVEGLSDPVFDLGSRDLPVKIEGMIHDYFELSPTLRQIVREVATVVLPNLQPSTLEKVASPLHTAPKRAELETYARSLGDELDRMRVLTGGRGKFETRVEFWRPGEMEGLGYVTVVVRPESSARVSPHVADQAIELLLDDLRKNGLLAGIVQGGLGLRGDLLVDCGDAIVFAKPLVRRLWLTSAALDDALRLVQHVRSSGTAA